MIDARGASLPRLRQAKQALPIPLREQPYHPTLGASSFEMVRGTAVVDGERESPARLFEANVCPGVRETGEGERGAAGDAQPSRFAPEPVRSRSLHTVSRRCARKGAPKGGARGP